MKNRLKNIQTAGCNGACTVGRSRGLYIFYPIFHCGLYCRVVSVTDNLCTKQENSSIFGSKSAVYNCEQFQIKSGLCGTHTVDLTRSRTLTRTVGLENTEWWQVMLCWGSQLLANLKKL